MKKKFFLFFLTIICYNAFAQINTVEFKIEGLSNSTVFLTDFEGDKNAIIDTAKANAHGQVLFTFPADRHIGMYKVVFDQNNFLDFIYNKENIVIESKMLDLQANIKVLKSNDNMVYFDFLTYQLQTDKKLDVLNYAIENYPQGDFYKSANAEYQLVVGAYKNKVQSILKSNPNSFAAKVIRTRMELYPSLDIPIYMRSDYKKEHYFDNVDFSDTSLLYTDIFTQKAIGYLGLFSSKHYTYEQQYMFFVQAIDTILKKTVQYPKVYDFVVDYLISGFESMGYSDVVTYIADRFLQQNSCEGNNHKTTLQRKALSNKNLIVGKSHPEFSFTARDGKLFTSAALSERYVLLLFWGTWCQHCREVIPQIKSMQSYLTSPLDIVAVSLDTVSSEWESYIEQMKLESFINTCDAKGWDGTIADSFNVYASPTFYLLYKGKIIAKPIELDDVARVLKENGILRK